MWADFALGDTVVAKCGRRYFFLLLNMWEEILESKLHLHISETIKLQTQHF